MTNKKKTAIVAILFLLVTIYSALFAACVNTEGREYTVTWKNHNGEILKTETVKEGDIPSYGGETPTKSGDGKYTYLFSGWQPAVSEVRADTTYTATFTSSENKYTVVWKNYDGAVLETDTDVPYGVKPVYDGATPKRDASVDVSYIFAGWTPEVTEVTADTVYTAKFTERHNGELIAGIDLVFSQDNKTAEYGLYPQTRVSDAALIAELNGLTTVSANGWYLFNGEYYAKETAKVYNNESYTFDDGTVIVNGNEYWFKCEPIKWQVLSCADGTYRLLSCKLLDAHNFYADYENRTIGGGVVYANNYEHSDVRKWLNGEFFNTAFALNNSYVQETVIDNGADGNKYACNDTKDKVYLPSYKDCLNGGFGFDEDQDNASVTRQCLTTDYARARGAWYNVKKDLQYNGSYWTRSPSGEYGYCAWNVNSGGYLSEYAVDGESHCVRPCVSLVFK